MHARTLAALFVALFCLSALTLAADGESSTAPKLVTPKPSITAAPMDSSDESSTAEASAEASSAAAEEHDVKPKVVPRSDAEKKPVKTVKSLSPSQAPEASFLQVDARCGPASDVKANCCSGMMCPYASGVCCATGAHCCPAGSVCLPAAEGQPVRCGTPQPSNSGPSGNGLPGSLGDQVPKMVIIQHFPNLTAVAAEAAAEKKPRNKTQDALDYMHNEHLNRLKQKQSEEYIKQHPYNCTVRLQVTNFLFSYYISKGKQVRRRLRSDFARNTNMDVHLTSVAGIRSLSLKTPGKPPKRTNAKDEKKKQALFVELAASLEALRFNPVSGLEVDMVLRAETRDRARQVARHVWLLLQHNRFELVVMNAMDKHARANPRKPMGVNRAGSRVFFEGEELSDEQEKQIAKVAIKSAEETHEELTNIGADLTTIEKVVRKRIAEWKDQHEDVKDAVEDKVGDPTSNKYKRRKVSSRPKQQQEKKPASSQPVFTALPMVNDFKPYGGQYREPRFERVGDLCVLTGLSRAPATRKQMAALPGNCRPSQRLIFPQHFGSSSFRMDVTAAGKVSWAGGATPPWVTFNHVVFPVMGANLLNVPLKNNWVAYGGAYGSVKYVKEDTFCQLSGLVKRKDNSVKSWTDQRNVIATLPGDCRPDERIAFVVNHHDKALEVDVLPNGDVVFVNGEKKYPWVSLSSIGFHTRGGSTLNLIGGLRARPGFRPPSYKRQGNLCVLSGALQGPGKSAITQLPGDCRPSKRLVFGATRGESTVRLDVNKDGRILWLGNKLDGWISLDGIIFTM